MPALPRGVAEELSLTAARPLDARWFTGHAIAALEAGDLPAAFEHATQAKKAANRSATVREVRGVIAYLLGNFKEALSELQAYRRLVSSPAQDPRIADCYRGLGRPMRAVEFLDERNATGTAAALVRAGALNDAGDHASAVAALRVGTLPDVEIPAPGFLPAGVLGTAAASGAKREKPKR